MGLTANIYKHNGQDSSNRGLSSRADRVTIVAREVHTPRAGLGTTTFEPVEGPFEPRQDAPAVILTLGSFGNYRAEEAEQVVNADTDERTWALKRRTDAIGPINGGTFIATSDGRFAEALGRPVVDVAIPLFDRFETQAEYDRYSA